MERASALRLPTTKRETAKPAPANPEEELCSPQRLARLSDDTTRTACQKDLLDRVTPPSEWLDESSWNEALSGPSRLHALRTLALLASEHDELRPLTLNAAERALQAVPSGATVHSGSTDSARLRASARFALAVHSPERAVRDWARLDAVERAAVLRQAHSPEIGAFLRDELRVRPLPPGPLAIVAERVVFGFPEGFERPARLRRVERRGPRLLALAELSHWLRPSDDVTTGPSVLEVRSWLGSSLPLERAATAFGLGSAPAPRATGLLIRAYENEVDPVVRRALVHALTRRRSAELHRLLDVVAALEPDRATRDAARRALDLEEDSHARFHSSDSATPPTSRSFTFDTLADGPVAAREAIYVATEEGRVIPVITEPDGYYAISGPTFTTPSR